MKKVKSRAPRSPALHTLCWCCVVLAALMNCSHFQRAHNADSLMPSLVSTMHWTPYFWRQDRYGMVIPWLAQPIHHPLYNLLFITYCSIAGAFAAFVLTARQLFRQSAAWPLIAVLAFTLPLCTSSRHHLFETFGTAQFYSSPLALSLLALLCLENPRPWRVACAVACAILAAWYNVAMPVLAGMLWCMGALVARVWREGAEQPLWPRLWRLGRAPLLLGAGTVFGVVCMYRARYHQVNFSTLVSFPEWCDGVVSLAKRSWELIGLGLRAPYLLIAMAGCLVVGASVAWRWRKQGTAAVFTRGGAVGVGAALLYAGLAATQGWAKQEGHDFRYWLPAWFVLIVASVGCGAGPWLQRLTERQMRQLMGATLLLATVAIVGRYGAPSIENVRGDLARLGGNITADAVANRCTHVFGDYWMVWPAALRANLAYYEAGSERQVFGLANRFEETQALWPADKTTWRIALPAELRTSAGGLMRFGIRQVREVASTPQTWVVAPAN